MKGKLFIYSIDKCNLYLTYRIEWCFIKILLLNTICRMGDDWELFSQTLCRENE